MKTEERLLRCPFCGGGNIELGGTIHPGETEKKYNVGCSDCVVWFDWLFTSEGEARQAWNHRQPTVTLDELGGGGNDCRNEPF